MARLIRIFSKTASLPAAGEKTFQVQSCRLVVPDFMTRRLKHKKSHDFKLPPVADRIFDDLPKSPNLICRLLLNEKWKEESKNKFGRSEEFYQKMDPYRLQSIKCIAGVSIAPYSVGWAKIDLNENNLTEYGSLILSQKNLKKEPETRNLYKKAVAIHDALPAADLYIFENHKTSIRTHSSDLTTVQLLSMIGVMLNNSHGVRNDDRVFYQKSTVIDYLYELRIKGERTSAGQKLQRMLNESVSVEEGNLSDIVVADFGCMKLKMNVNFLRKVFADDPLKRDASAVAFLLALSFIELNLPSSDARESQEVDSVRHQPVNIQ